jgi:hypothetical protein
MLISCAARAGAGATALAAHRSTIESQPESLPSLSSVSGHGASLIDDDDEYDEEYDITTPTEGEVDGFIKFRPTIDELLHGEEAARNRSRSLASSSMDESLFRGRSGSNSQPLLPSSSDHATLLTGRFYKQGGPTLAASSQGTVSLLSRCHS